MGAILSLKEIFAVGLWLKVCKLKGYDEWIVADGLADMDDTVEFNEQEVLKLGLRKGKMGHPKLISVKCPKCGRVVEVLEGSITTCTGGGKHEHTKMIPEGKPILSR